MIKRSHRIIIKAILVFVILYLCLQVKVFREILNIVLIAFIISYSLRPVHRKMVMKGMNRKLSAALLILGLVAFFLTLLILFVPNIIKESFTINKTLLEVKDLIQNAYENFKVVNNNRTVFLLLSAVYAKVDAIVLVLLNSAFDRVMKLGEHLLAIAVVPITVYYFLSEYEYISNKALIFVPVERRNIFVKIREDIDKVLGRYILSQFILSVLVGILTFIILILLKVDYPVLLSLISAIFNIIPYFGPLFGSLPAILMALLKSPQTAFWTALCLYFVQQLEGDVIAPKITGDSVSIHPLLVIFLLIIGGKLGGFVGMVLAVPVGVIIKVLYEDLNYYLF